MASLRRNRTMPTDGAIAKFLYTILKQLDLKSIDWQEVANGLDITNGHAARMRFSRFKQQMEGTASQPRKPKPAAPRPKKTKPEKPPSSTKAPINPQVDEQREPDIKGQSIVKGEPELQGEDGAKGEPVVKSEPGLEDAVMQDVELEAELEPTIKAEITEDEPLWANGGITNSASTQKTSPELYQQLFKAPYLSDKAAHQLYPEPFVRKEDAENTQVSIVKRESTCGI